VEETEETETLEAIEIEIEGIETEETEETEEIETEWTEDVDLRLRIYAITAEKLVTGKKIFFFKNIFCEVFFEILYLIYFLEIITI
jgi:hypothetical protein